MKCKFCGYTNGWVWRDGIYTESEGEYGDFWLIGKLTPFSGSAYEDEAKYAVMCPVTGCQRTQIVD